MENPPSSIFWLVDGGVALGAGGGGGESVRDGLESSFVGVESLFGAVGGAIFAADVILFGDGGEDIFEVWHERPAGFHDLAAEVIWKDVKLFHNSAQELCSPCVIGELHCYFFELFRFSGIIKRFYDDFWLFEVLPDEFLDGGSGKIVYRFWHGFHLLNA